jgi:ATP-dependent helicase/nuclease subunit A
MITDLDERARALAPDQSFLVEAPAGSGKTELLIQRYLRLLAVVKQPESIVAMTFTRKAAAEMKERVMKALHEAAAGTIVESEYAKITRELADAALAQDRAQDWRLLEDSRRLQIQTIDSFSSMLTRQMPLLAGFGGNPEVIEHAEELYRLAARRAIVALAGDYQEIFRDVAVHFDGDLARLESQITKMLMKRDQWIRELERRDTEALRDEVEDTLRENLEDRLREAWELWPRDIPGRPEPAVKALPEWCAAAERMLLAGSRSARKLGKYYPILELREDFCRALHVCRGDAPLTLSDEQWRLLSDFIVVLQIALLQLEMVFRERGQVDFTRISEAAVVALGTVEQPTDLAFRLDYRIEHLLVDEFQDTSLVQNDLLNLLTAQWTPGDGRSLFLVGDPMQSIYRFRNAEVGLFLRAGERGIGAVRLEKLQLQSNFRSQPEIVRWVNRVVGRIAPERDDSARGQVALRNSTAAKTDEGEPPTLHTLIDDKDGEAEAAKVVALAREALERKDTTAILVRTRKQLQAILPALRRAKQPYEAIDIDALDEEQHILDLLSLTRAFHHLADRASWLACLRAPWCGLKLADLMLLVEDRPKGLVLDLLTDADRLLRLSVDGRTRAGRFLDVARNAVGKFGRFPVRDIVEAAWIAVGGPAALESTNQREDAAEFFELLDQFGRAGRISDFTLFGERLRYLFAKPSAAGSSCIQVMTIHAAKGLQFDTVILPQLQAGAGSLEAELLVWTTRLREDGTEGLMMAALPQAGEADPFYKLVRRELRARDTAEDIRLLYVAVTRAKRRLHLLGNAATNKKGDGLQKPRSSFLSLLWDDVKQDFEAKFKQPRPVSMGQQMFDLTPAPSTILHRLPISWSLPRPQPAVPWRPQYQTEVASRRRLTYEWVSEASRHVGTAVHDLLRRVAEEGLEEWSDQRAATEASFISAELLRLGVARHDSAAAVNRVTQALLKTLNSERGRWILSPHRDANCEWAMSGARESRFENARIDRTFIDETGCRWIIDYKTSSHEGGSRDVFLNREKERYRPQLEVYARLLQDMGESNISVGLYFPLLDEWVAWQVEEREAGITLHAE